MRITLTIFLLSLLVRGTNAQTSQSIDCSFAFDTLCNKGHYWIDYTATGNYGPNNYFYMEVKDQQGNYYPQPLWTSTAPSGSLNFTSWGGFPTGGGIQFRVNSTDPAVIGNDSPMNAYFFNVDTTVIQASGQLEAATNFPGSTFQWLECSHVVLPGETNPTFFNGSPAAYYAVEVTQSGCVDTSFCYEFITAALPEVNEEKVKVYPNPVAGCLNIETVTDWEEVRIFILEMSGRILYEDVKTSASIIQISTENLPIGIYEMILKGERGVFRTKFIKE